jgi:aryl-alcohol dehydrogenase-like predicted oxidoreductase
VKQRHLGRSGLVVSRLGLGTMTWGRDTDEDDAAAQLIAFREAAAPWSTPQTSTPAARASGCLGRLLADVVPRDEVVLATKAYGVTGPGPMGRGTSRGTCCPRWTPRCAGSAPTTSTCGSCTPGTRSRRGRSRSPRSTPRCRAAGCATSASRTTAAGSWRRPRPGSAAWPGRTPIVSDQVEYSLLQRGVEREVVRPPASWASGLLPVVAAGRGVLTGKYRKGAPADSRGASEHLRGFVAHYLDDPGASQVVDAVVTAADGLGVSPVAVALAWVRDRPGVVAPIVGARSAAQLQAALAAESVQLPPAIRSALDDVSAVPLAYPERTSHWTSPDLED